MCAIEAYIPNPNDLLKANKITNQIRSISGPVLKFDVLVKRYP